MLAEWPAADNQPAMIARDESSAPTPTVDTTDLQSPGISRRKLKDGFRYRDASGEPVTDPETLDRIRQLAIPPAWADVWINPEPDGHLQATGRDARDRKQYLYHTEFRADREAAKFRRLRRFGESLPAIRRRARADVREDGLGRSRVLAAVVSLLDASLIRVGNQEYLKQNASVGLTTMNRSHARIDGKTIRFRFAGKSGKDHDITVASGAIAKVVRECRDVRCDFLFSYLGEGGRRVCVTSADVNAYLREAAGRKVSAKDFRTWSASTLALALLSAEPVSTSATQGKRVVNAVLDQVAERLGNTRAVCRKSYVHPAIIAAYEDGSLARRRQVASASRGLTKAETDLLAFLRSRKAAV